MADFTHEMITTLNRNIDAAKAIRDTEPTGYALHTADYTLALIQTGDIVRLGSPLDGNLVLIHDPVETVRTRARWNDKLSPAQKKAGCTLMSGAYVDVLSGYISTQLNLLTLISAAK